MPSLRVQVEQKNLKTTNNTFIFSPKGNKNIKKPRPQPQFKYLLEIESHFGREFTKTREITRILYKNSFFGPSGTGKIV